MPASATIRLSSNSRCRSAKPRRRVASLRTRVAEYESRYKRTKELMKSMPQIEAEFAQLNRDYEINKKNYDQLVTRRESAELTGDLESAGAGADFRLIDPPRVIAKPVAPNRLVLLPLGPVAGNRRRALCCLCRQSVATCISSTARSLRDETGLPCSELSR